MNSANTPPGGGAQGGGSIAPNWLSQERLNQLTPQLIALQEDFNKLEELAAPDTEPGIAPDYEGYNNEQR